MGDGCTDAVPAALVHSRGSGVGEDVLEVAYYLGNLTHGNTLFAEKRISADRMNRLDRLRVLFCWSEVGKRPLTTDCN